MKHFVVARCYDRKGRLLSRASNSYTQTHPLQAHFAKLAGEPSKIYLHAEIHALIRAGDKPVYKIVVERYNKSGQPVLARPCKICQLAISAYNVTLVEHT